MKIGEYEFPDSCFLGCPELHTPFDQGNACSRCPIFNCTGDIKLLEPEDYNPLAAKGYYEWFEDLGLI